MSKSTKPLLSVRLMTFNHEPFIVKALKGVDMQKTNFDFEVVIGDDFSTDNTLKLIKAYKFNNLNVSVNILNREIGGDYYRKRKKNGRLYNFYDILKNCQGKYVALLDGDDYWSDSNKLQKQIDFLEANRDYSICWTGYKILRENKIINPIWYNDRKAEALWDISFDNFSSPYCTMTLTTVFEKKSIAQWLSNFLNFRFFKDNTLYFLCLNSGKGMFLNCNTSVYRQHPDSVYALQPDYNKAYSNYTNYEELLIKFPKAREYNIITKRNNWKNQFLRELYKRPIPKVKKWAIRFKLEAYFKWLAIKAKL
ncbi:glycosyltransferase family 2 protein [Winogradskyella sp. A3E31]|uniref:glycosyltransferase family 2 protein n=1 Tax=Winogradskyella sp. A3E31 TaxID=3349637 RepID=UPI00398B64FE